MKVLVLDANVSYMNPTRVLMAPLLSLLGDVRFFGPGYVSSNELKNGLNTFISKYGPFDVAISTEHFSMFHIKDDPAYESFIKHYKNSFFYQFNDSDLVHFWNQTKEFMNLDVYKVALFIAFDFQQITKVRTDYLKENFHIVGGLSRQFWKSTDQLKNLHLEKFSNTINNNWFEFISSSHEKILPILHFISPNEFDFTPIHFRKKNWSVLGANYFTRKKAMKEFARSKIEVNTGKSKWYNIIRIASRLGLRPYSKQVTIDHLQKSFFSALKQTKFSYTCGSKLYFPIRKYFEIPTAGTLLVCEPCNGFESMGFIDGENSIISDPERLPSLGNELLNDLDHIQEIILAGQKLMFEKHSIYARAEQIRKSIEAGLKGHFKGAKWERGNFFLKEGKSATPLNDKSDSS
ncbi:MAG: hypothetical protein CMD68_00475 [Gammaproteobacteria bacterium]|nr:hypothetical protein [Gammaproteobacteria bacterium]